MLRKIRSLFLTAAAFSISLVIAYVLGEALVYGVMRKELTLFPRYVTGVAYGDWKIRANLPGSQYRHKSYDGTWEFRINPQGFRDSRTFSYEKPAGTVRVLVLGDSFTVGYETGQEQTYSAYLEKALREKGLNVEVLNAGVSGYSNAEELVFLEQEGIKFSPDIVILGFFINDPSDNVRADLYRLRDGRLEVHSKTYLPGIRIHDFLNGMAWYRWLSENSYLHNYLNQTATWFVKEKLEKANAGDIKAGGGGDLSRYESDLAFALVKRMSEISRENGARFIFLDIPTYARERSFPAGYPVREICDYFIDGLQVLEPYWDTRVLYRQHGTSHWTDQAHKIIGDDLAKVLEPAVREKSQPLKGA